MKATPLIPAAGASTNFYNTVLAPVAAFVVTLANLTVRLMRNKSGTISTVFVDRSKDDLDEKGIFYAREGGILQNLGTFPAGTHKVVAQFNGVKDNVTGELTFGVGAIAAADVKLALSDAVDNLAIPAQLHADYQGYPEFVEGVKKALVPSIATIKFPAFLGAIYDVLPIIRPGCQAGHRLIVEFVQDEQTGTIRIAEIADADEGEISHAGTNLFFQAETNCPETAAVASAVPKLFGE